MIDLKFINEDYLHYVWKYRMINTDLLITDDGQVVDIIHPGFHNHHAGPDFSHAKIRIGDQLWVGNVEIHVRHSDWDKHGHGGDSSYDNIILHVVYEKDVKELSHVKQHFPTIELKNRLNFDHYSKYNTLLSSGRDFPCQNLIGTVDSPFVKQWIEKQLIERLKFKAELIQKDWQFFQGDWDTVMYRYLSRALGLKVNADPMWWLSGALPLSLVRKYTDQEMAINALYFGQSGLLFSPTIRQDAYVHQLTQNYHHLVRRHELQCMDPSIWRFLRMRPSSFPTVRVAQLALIIQYLPHLFSAFLDINTVEEARAYLAIAMPDYWHNHYILGKPSKRGVQSISRSTIDRLIINAVVPVLFAYSQYSQDESRMEKMLDWMYVLPSERNVITEMFANSGVLQFDAATSQATIHTYHNSCRPRKCLQCAIGNKLLLG
ncbi:MAG: DUF2851 family protein [Cryomorphaceae bacterium]|nr:DUF2851 family protein [Cryomorphaceae bacterium]